MSIPARAGETSGYILGSASAGVHPRVLAPFAVDQAADLCSCGHENDDSAAGLKRIPLVRSRGTPVAQEVAMAAYSIDLRLRVLRDADAGLPSDEFAE